MPYSFNKAPILMHKRLKLFFLVDFSLFLIWHFFYLTEIFIVIYHYWLSLVYVMVKVFCKLRLNFECSSYFSRSYFPWSIYFFGFMVQEFLFASNISFLLRFRKDILKSFHSTYGWYFICNLLWSVIRVWLCH